MKEKASQGVSNLYQFVDYCFVCIERTAAELRREEIRRWIDGELGLR